MVEKGSEEPGRQVHRPHSLRREMATTVTWRCPKCKIEAEIKGNTKTIRSKVDQSKTVQSFPTHHDCELARPIKKMNFAALIKVSEE